MNRIMEILGILLFWKFQNLKTLDQFPPCYFHSLFTVYSQFTVHFPFSNLNLISFPLSLFAKKSISPSHYLTISLFQNLSHSFFANSLALALTSCSSISSSNSPFHNRILPWQIVASIFAWEIP